METGIHIGTTASKEELEPLTNAITRILEARADQETIRAALGVLQHHAEVRNVSISDIVLNGDQSHTHHHHPQVEWPDETEDGEGDDTSTQGS